MLDKVALEQVFLRVLRFSPVSVIPPFFHAHFYLRVNLTVNDDFENLMFF